MLRLAFVVVAVILGPAVGSAQTVSISSPSEVRPGDAIIAVVVGGPATPTDWVALTPAADPDGAYIDWKYLNGSSTPPSSGLASATVRFVVQAPGTYNVRFYGNNRLANKLATSATITVSPTAPPSTPPTATERWFRFCLDDGVTCYEGMLQRVPGGGTE
jgi:hypothetical protein